MSTALTSNKLDKDLLTIAYARNSHLQNIYHKADKHVQSPDSAVNSTEGQIVLRLNRLFLNSSPRTGMVHVLIGVRAFCLLIGYIVILEAVVWSTAQRPRCTEHGAPNLGMAPRVTGYRVPVRGRHNTALREAQSHSNRAIVVQIVHIEVHVHPARHAARSRRLHVGQPRFYLRLVPR